MFVVKFKYNLTLSLISLFLAAPLLHSSEINLKRDGLIAYDKGNYKKSYQIFKKALRRHPNDGEIHYYLGISLHRVLYDIPPREYNEKKSNEILSHLYKALKLNSHPGNSRYFIGVEHGVRALFYLRMKDTLRVKGEYIKGRNSGGYPDWLIEYNRNTLKSCDSNAVLFTYGDALTHPMLYLQFVKNYRRDVTVVSGALLNSSLYIKFINEGIKNFYRPLSMDTTLKSKSLILDVVRKSKEKRPIYFTIGWPGSRMPELDSLLQLCGLTYKVNPSGTDESKINPGRIRRVLLNEENYSSISTLKKSDIPSCSGMLQNYRFVLSKLARYYADRDRQEMGLEIMEKMEEYIPGQILPYSKDFIASRKRLEDLLGMRKVSESRLCWSILNEMYNYGIGPALSKYNELKDEYGNSVELCEGMIQEHGTRLILDEKYEEAVKVFKLNIALFPDSYRAYNALANAYLKSGDKERAVKNYRKALGLNLENKTAQKKLDELGK